MPIPPNVKSKQLILDRIEIVEVTGCWNWKLATCTSGYGKVKIAQKQYLVHRLVWELWHGPLPAKGNKVKDNMCVLHKCDNRICCNPDHLFLGTYKENTDDMINKERDAKLMVKGEGNIQAKLKRHQVEEIRKSYSTGLYTQREIAEDYDVTQSLISYIVNYKRNIWSET